MFNEAFWFFYMVSVVDGLDVTLFVGGVIGIFTLIVGCAMMADSGVENKDINAFFTKWIKIPVILLILCPLVPPPEAFYAGAVQYVGESAELDDTLRQLKKLVDQKIAELDKNNKNDN